jgi:basic membrane protein A and related proteins
VKLISRTGAAKALSLAAVSALVLAGCAAAPEDVTPSETAAADKFLACAVSDEGVWLDKSFNESVYDGMMAAEADLDVEVSLLESANSDAIKPNLQQMVDQGCDLVIAVGFAGNGPVNEMAEAYPNVNFVTVDGDNAGGFPNLKPFNYNMQESTYLIGYVAAHLSKTGIISTYGGEQYGSVTPFMDGFYYGAMAYNKDFGTNVKVIGWDPKTAKGDFAGDGSGIGFISNNATSKAIALAQVNAGADFVFPVGGDQFGAVSEAFKELGVDGLSAGVDKDIAQFSPEYASFMVTSAEKRMNLAVFDLIKDLSTGGTFTADAYIGTLANGGTALSPFYDFDAQISDEVKAKLKEIQDAIIAGTLDPLS